MYNLFTLLDATTDATTDVAQNNSILMTVVIYGGILFLMWFLLIRPQKKRQKETEAMQNAIKVGDSVLTSGGFYGVVVDAINDVFILEFGTNKTVRVPIKRSSVLAVGEPDLSINKIEEATTEDKAE
jgi:preprotein translocase subunit YajC